MVDREWGRRVRGGVCVGGGGYSLKSSQPTALFYEHDSSPYVERRDSQESSPVEWKSISISFGVEIFENRR